jgi:hypothetical protein
MKYGIPTQVATTDKTKKGMAVISNILKQMNVKCNGDLYHLTLPKSLAKYKRPMIVGIDISH